MPFLSRHSLIISPGASYFIGSILSLRQIFSASSTVGWSSGRRIDSFPAHLAIANCDTGGKSLTIVLNASFALSSKALFFDSSLSICSPFLLVICKRMSLSSASNVPMLFSSSCKRTPYDLPFFAVASLTTFSASALSCLPLIIVSYSLSPISCADISLYASNTDKSAYLPPLNLPRMAFHISLILFHIRAYHACASATSNTPSMPLALMKSDSLPLLCADKAHANTSSMKASSDKLPYLSRTNDLMLSGASAMYFSIASSSGFASGCVLAYLYSLCANSWNDVSVSMFSSTSTTSPLGSVAPANVPSSPPKKSALPLCLAMYSSASFCVLNVVTFVSGINAFSRSVTAFACSAVTFCPPSVRCRRGSPFPCKVDWLFPPFFSAGLVSLILLIRLSTMP